MISAPPLKLRQLQYFLAVAELQHFTHAAGKLNVTQPTLSHQIAKLEELLGTPLFDRIGKVVRLTEAGKVFRGFAETSLRNLSDGRMALNDLHGMLSGSIRVGASLSFVRQLLPPLLARFACECPDIFIDVRQMNAIEIEMALAKGDLDIGIGYSPASLNETELEPLFEEKLLLVVTRDHRLASRQSIPMWELDAMKLALLPKNYLTRTILDGIFRDIGIQPKIVSQSNSVAILLGMIQNTGIATILLESSLGASDDFHIVELADPAPRRTSALLWSRHTYRSAATRRLAQMIREAMPVDKTGIELTR